MQVVPLLVSVPRPRVKSTEFNVRPHIDVLAYAIVAIIAIAVSLGIGLFIIGTLANALQQAGGNQTNITQVASLLNNQMGLIGTVVTIIFVAILAAVGIALVIYLRQGFGIGGK